MDKKGFLEKPGIGKKLLAIFCCVLGVMLVAEFFIHKHSFFAWEEWPWFHAAFGFVAFVVLILAAKYILRPLIERKEDYYDD